MNLIRMCVGMIIVVLITGPLDTEEIFIVAVALWSLEEILRIITRDKKKGRD